MNRNMRRARGWLSKISKIIPNEAPAIDEDIADLISLNIDGLKDVRVSAYPCDDLLWALSIHKSFYKLVTNAGLIKFTTKEVDQYMKLTYIYSCKLSDLMMGMTRLLSSASIIGNEKCLLMNFAGPLA